MKVDPAIVRAALLADPSVDPDSLQAQAPGQGDWIAS
jgi:hypothetical protein